MIFGLCKFHQYIYGRTFTLVTDHKLLTMILGSKQTIPSLAAARLQCWALLLAGYSYNIRFKPTSAHQLADALSRLPLKDSTTVGNLPDSANFNTAQIDSLPLTAVKLASATCKDPILSKALDYTRKGWPEVIPECLKPYWKRHLELAIGENTINLVWCTCSNSCGSSTESYGGTPSRPLRSSSYKDISS